MSKTVTVTFGSGVVVRGGAVPSGTDAYPAAGTVVWLFTVPQPVVSVPVGASSPFREAFTESFG